MSTVSSSETKKLLLCSFCGKNQHEVRKLIAGPTVFICDECVELCMDIIGEENKSSSVKSRDGIPTRKEIRKVLHDHGIGQDHAKKVLSVAVHNHYKRLNHQTKHNDVISCFDGLRYREEVWNEQRKGNSCLRRQALCGDDWRRLEDCAGACTRSASLHPLLRHHRHQGELARI